ncbi:MAG: protein translocase subunit SecF [Deltaproteobacteria bacterium]|nr:protein translocase subunit SecF [Deltaproteobacteria bacterium]
MEIFTDTNINFMKYRRQWTTVSIVLVLLSLFVVLVRGHLNLGIDFAGGTQLTIKFAEAPQVDELRGLLSDAGIGDAQIQRYGAEIDNEVIIKTPVIKGSEEGSREQIVAVLNTAFNGDGSGFDLNQRGADSLTAHLVSLDPDAVGDDDEARQAHYSEVAAHIMTLRQRDGLLTSWSDLDGEVVISGAVRRALEASAEIGTFAVLGAENVGPQIGKELRSKGLWAVGLSLFGMLMYIWFRFELRFGIGALVAVVHDVLVTLGLFALMRFEFNLTTVAAFLTLVGYSVNDSVVVFDRVRENLMRSRVEPLVDLMNRSINQMLSRTILTSGTTLLAVGSLLFLGGEVLRGFGFIMTVGVIAGTYSSIYIASPFALLWEDWFGRAARTRRASTQKAKAASR